MPGGTPTSDAAVYLSVIIPAYNEEARIGRTLADVQSYLAGKPYRWEIIIVDDGSTDKTFELVQAIVRKEKGMRLMRHGINEGKGWAVRTGMLAAKGKYRLFMDADNSTSIRHFELVRRAFEAGADIVLGSRHVAGSRIIEHQTWPRELLGYLFRLLITYMFRFGVTDTQNGFKAFTAEAALTLFPRQEIPTWAFDVEILFFAKRKGFNIVEIPVTWKNDAQTRLSLLQLPQMLVDIFRIRFVLWTHDR